MKQQDAGTVRPENALKTDAGKQCAARQGKLLNVDFSASWIKQSLRSHKNRAGRESDLGQTLRVRRNTPTGIDAREFLRLIETRNCVSDCK